MACKGLLCKGFWTSTPPVLWVCHGKVQHELCPFCAYSRTNPAPPLTFWSSVPCENNVNAFLTCSTKVAAVDLHFLSHFASQSPHVSSGTAALVMCRPTTLPTAAWVSTHMAAVISWHGPHRKQACCLWQCYPTGLSHRNLAHMSLFVVSLGSSHTTLFISKCPFLREAFLDFFRPSQPIMFCHSNMCPSFRVHAKVIIAHFLMWGFISLELCKDRYLMIPSVSTMLSAS